MQTQMLSLCLVAIILQFETMSICLRPISISILIIYIKENLMEKISVGWMTIKYGKN